MAGGVFGGEALHRTTTSLKAITGIGIGSALGDVFGIVPLYNLSAVHYAAAGLVDLSYLRGEGVEEAAVPELGKTS